MMNLEIEKELFSKGYKSVAGVDEVGRGPLAGPVVAACVVIDQNTRIPEVLLKEVRDSKKISEKKREKLNEIIWQSFDNVSVELCDAGTIDRINILEASFLAMKKALSALRKKPDFVLVDGKFEIRNYSLPQKTIIKGDAKVFSIAAASIVAKVVRDKIMCEYANAYPEYGFERHKGYGTKLHMEALLEKGPCPLHRRSFAPVERCLAPTRIV